MNKNGQPRDTHKQQVYIWQYHHLPDGMKLSQQELRDLAVEVYETYGYPNEEPTVIVTSAKKTWSHYHWYPRHEIRLAAGWGQKLKYFLHELTHALMHTMGIGKQVAGHGKEFVSLFVELCELWLDASDDDLEYARTKGEKLGTRHSYQE